jgi:hypothetical protein
MDPNQETGALPSKHQTGFSTSIMNGHWGASLRKARAFRCRDVRFVVQRMQVVLVFHRPAWSWTSS